MGNPALSHCSVTADRRPVVAMIFGMVSKSSTLSGMSYIVQRKDRFYVVAYDGLDPDHRQGTPPLASRR